MHPSIKTTASAALLLTLTACASIPQKKTSPLSRAQVLIVPTVDADPLNIRTQTDLNFIAGDIYSREGNSEKAIDSFTKILAVTTTAPTIHMRLAEEYQKLDKLTEAIHHAELAIHQAPQNIDAHLFLGGLYSAEKIYNKAIAQYNIVLGLQPDNEEAPVYLGSLFADMKDYKKAEHYFKSLLKSPKYETPHMAHYYLGLIYQDQKGVKQQKLAEKAFKKSLELKPNFENAVLALANFYLKQSQRTKALSATINFSKQNHFHRAVADMILQIYIEAGELDKGYEQLEVIAGNSENSLEIEMKMALILIEQKRFFLAAEKLKKIVTSSAAPDSARYYLAAVFEETGAVEDAIREYMMVSPSNAHFSEAIVQAAHLLKGLGNLNRALEIAERGLKAKANPPQVYTMYASLLDAKSDYLGATRVLEEGLGKFSKNVGLLFQHAVMLDRLGNKDGMIAQMKKVLEIEPDHVQSLSYLAFTLAELNQHLPEAERLARRASELEPTDAYVLDTLGWVLLKQQKISEAIQTLEKAYGLQSSASIIAEHLADAYLTKSMTAEAKAMYNKAVGLTTDETRAHQIRSKLGNIVF